jgi:hypothetical protein
VNYIKWIIKSGKLIPTLKNTLKNYDQVYSYKLLEYQPIEIINILKQSLDFAFNENIENYMTEAGFKFKTLDNIDKDTIKEILTSIYNCYLTQDKNSKHFQAILKEYYFNLMLILSKTLNTTYNGYFINNNGEFTAKENIFYINDTDIKTVLQDKLLNNGRSILKVPTDKKEFNNFLDFCRFNMIKIYERQNVIYTHSNPQIDENISVRVKRLTLYLNDNSSTKIALGGIQNITFYSCSKIFFEAHNENFAHGLCYYNNNTIYYLKNNIYKSWEHPAILFYISEFLANILGIKDKHSHFITLLRLDTEEDIKEWINNKTMRTCFLI